MPLLPGAAPALRLAPPPSARQSRWGPPVIAAVVVLVAYAAAWGLAPAASVPDRMIDTAASSAAFSVEHIYVDRVTGTVPIASGFIKLMPHTRVPLGVVAVLDPTKIKTGDDDRDGALQAPDWFDTQKFPNWSFSATNIVTRGSDAFALDGTLTIRGVTRPVHMNVTISGPDENPHYHAVGTIDRHAYGMNKARLDPVVGNTVDVTLDVAIK